MTTQGVDRCRMVTHLRKGLVCAAFCPPQSLRKGSNLYSSPSRTLSPTGRVCPQRAAPLSQGLPHPGSSQTTLSCPGAPSQGRYLPGRAGLAPESCPGRGTEPRVLTFRLASHPQDGGPSTESTSYLLRCAPLLVDRPQRLCRSILGETKKGRHCRENALLTGHSRGMCCPSPPLLPP